VDCRRAGADRESAAQFGGDADYVWTAFRPTNVRIHEVATAIELGDIQVAVDFGPWLDTGGPPIERLARHGLAVAHALILRDRADEVMAVRPEAETITLERVRHHYLSRRLTMSWIAWRGHMSALLV
jgi:hypothetical protein